MKIAIIGAGNMGGAMALGLAAGTQVRPEYITVSDPSADNLEAISRRQPAIVTTADNTACISGADIIILAVKPWLVQTVIDELRPAIDFSSQALASIAGGVGIDQLATMLTGKPATPATPLPCPIIRIVPNTAIALAESMTFVSSRASTPELDNSVVALFSELGQAMLVEERLMNAATALASCGIAYALRYVRAATEGGVELGFRADQAQRIVAQTLRGAAALLDADGSHAEAEIDKVTTPGGLTIRGLNAMEEAGFTASVIRGLRASMPK
ncbi:MAG: pyrroline-5-carboxylate reductase [Bacteroidaceae bacterium]|nr:pyrroline-5-carboxylate reductase [Bacteroidaceae bacterium]